MPQAWDTGSEKGRIRLGCSSLPAHPLWCQERTFPWKDLPWRERLKGGAGSSTHKGVWGRTVPVGVAGTEARGASLPARGLTLSQVTRAAFAVYPPSPVPAPPGFSSDENYTYISLYFER